MEGVSIEGFSGLNLLHQPNLLEPSQAIACLDVDITERAGIEERAGTQDWAAVALAERGDSLGAFYTAAGARHLLVGAGTRLLALNAGVLVDTETGLAGGPYGFTEYGAPGVETAYAGNGQDTLRRYDGATWTAPTATVDGIAGLAMPRGRLLGVQTPDNRLVVAGFETATGGPNGAASSPSDAYVSEVGNPLAWLTNNRVTLTPGDGERITALIAWRDQVFLFKESKFFVLTGNSVGPSGDPVFNWRAIDTGIGCVGPRAACVGRDGVYFVDRRGIYRTTGHDPAVISTDIEPLFRGDVPPHFLDAGESYLSAAGLENTAIEWHNERIHVACTPQGSATNTRVLVHDPRFGWWTLHSLPAADLLAFRPLNRHELFLALAAGPLQVRRQMPGLATDQGAAIPSYWWGGWGEFGSFDVKTARQFRVWGQGRYTYRLARDFHSDVYVEADVDHREDTDTWGDGSDPTDIWGDGSDPDDRWGPAPDITGRLVRPRSLAGNVFSTRFAAAEAGVPWSVHRIAHYLSGRSTRSVIR